MPELRLRFEKTGKAAYLSHLDVLRTFQRAFIRAAEPTVNTGDVSRALGACGLVPPRKCRRIALYDGEMKEFA